MKKAFLSIVTASLLFLPFLSKAADDSLFLNTPYQTKMFKYQLAPHYQPSLVIKRSTLET